jgi:hypothetical protein
MALRIPNIYSKRKQVFSFTPRPLYSQRKSVDYRLNRRLGRLQSRCGTFGGEINIFTVLGIEIRSIDIPTLYRLSYAGSSWVMFCNIVLSLWREVVSLTSSHKLGVLSLVGYPRLIIQYNSASNLTTCQT